MSFIVRNVQPWAYRSKPGAPIPRWSDAGEEVRKMNDAWSHELAIQTAIDEVAAAADAQRAAIARAMKEDPCYGWETNDYLRAILEELRALTARLESKAS